LVKCFLSSLQVFDLSSDSSKVSIVEFLRFNFCSICSNYSFSDSLANLSHFKLFLMLILNFNILLMLSLLSLLSMLLIVTESRCILDNLLNWTSQDSWFKNRRRDNHSLRRAWSDWSWNISPSVINRLVFNFLIDEMSINIIRNISHILPPVLPHIVGDVSRSLLSILWLVSIALKAFGLIGSWTWEVVRTLISLSLFVILIWSHIFMSWFVFLQVWLWSHLLFNTSHCWHQKWLSWWRFLFFLHILSMILFFVLNVHFLCFFLIHKF
jgi:hypothetical protein